MWRQLHAANQIWNLVAEAKARGTPTDDSLFKDIGGQLGIGSKTLVKELYREIVHIKGRP
jgi:hypothetical protein